MATQVERAIAYAKSKIGSTRWRKKTAKGWVGLCQGFVADCYHEGAGMPRRSAGSAEDARKMWQVSSSSANIPLGAAVYMKSPNYPQYGHVGLYVGGGQVISHLGSIKSRSIAQLSASGYTFKGWGWNGGVRPSGSSADPTPGGAALSGTGTPSTEASQAAAAVIHIPQTEKVWTAYQGDKPADKPADAYRVTWQSMSSGQIRDITDRCSVPELTDDADSLCLELTFDVMQSADDYFVQPLALSCGDMIAVTNTGSGEVVFLGQIQRASGNYRTGLSVRCLDGGRLLTSNEVIMQFNNCPAKTALSQIANKVGIKTILCPELVSSVYGIYKESAASIIQKILETVTSENGVPYFVRMAGDTLTVRSYGKDVIDCFFRQAENLSQFNVLDEISDPQGEWSIEDLKNRVIIYSEKDSAVSILATASDAGSEARYGRRVAVESFSDDSGVTAQARAKTLLAAKNRVSETFRAEAYGSDRVTAGVRLRPNIREMTGEFWVKAVTHHLGTPHRMSLTLVRAEVMG